MVIFYVLIIFGIVIVDSVCIEGNDTSFIALIFGSMVLASDAGVYVLGNQQGKKLYNIFGSNPKYFLLGFVSSLGIILASLCIVQIFMVSDFDFLTITTVVGTCPAITIILIDFGVVINRRSKQIGLFSKIFIGLACLFVTSIILGLSSYNFALPLLVAVLYLVFDVRNARQDVVKKLYWDI